MPPLTGPLRPIHVTRQVGTADLAIGGHGGRLDRIGVVPAPGYITKSDAEKESMAVSKLRDPLIRKFRQQIKDGANVDDLVPQMLRAGLSRQDIRFVIRTASDIPRPHRLKSFGKEEE